MKLTFKHFQQLFFESMLSEGKHWPEDYIKTAFNTIKNSDLGKQSWYTDDLIKQDINTFINEFGPLSHKNSNLGYFATIIRWFVAYAGNNKNKYQEFIERKLDGIIKTLLWLSNNPNEEAKLKEQIKTKWTFNDFEKYQKSVEDKIDAEQIDKLKKVKLQDKGYEIIPINSYKELHDKFGGNKTGYKGDSRWCHTNGSSTYNSWTNGGNYNFFVLAKKGWENIEPPNPADETTKAYDEYGTSLIAILVDVASGKLLNATLRWNHVIEPSLEKEGASVDKAFLGWGDLAEVTGKDVEKEIKDMLKEKQEELQKEIDDANRQVNGYLERYKNKIKELNPETNFKIINKFKDIVTKIKIPDGVTSIGANAFFGCRMLSSIVIPDGVTSIGKYAFYLCNSLTNVTLPNSVTSIGTWAFYGCNGLTSITIPNSVTSIGYKAFENCTSLNNVTIPNSVTEIGESAFYNCTSLTNVTISNSVTEIGLGVFYGCSSLKSMTIPDSVKSIGQAAFASCSSLKHITIGGGVESVGYGAFYGCSNLESVTIPSSVTSIERGTFYKCNNLKNLIFKGKTMDEVKAMENYPWEINNSPWQIENLEKIIKVEK